MNEWVNFVIQRNIEVSIVILAVLVARVFMKTLPKKYSYMLWSVVGIKMLFTIPVKFSFNIFSLMKKAFGGLSHSFVNENGVISLNGALVEVSLDQNQKLISNMDQLTKYSGTKEIVKATLASSILMWVVAAIWVVGILIFGISALVTYRNCKKKVEFAVRSEKNIWECDYLPSPFVLGMIHPQIYIPFHMEAGEKSYILAHEQYHIKRKDMIVKFIAYILMMIYWINPLCILAYQIMGRDMEMSCDEAVLTQLGTEIREAYSSSLLSFATGKRVVHFAPLAFGESDASKRIKNVLKFEKKGVVAAVLGVMVVVVIAALCLTKQNDVTGSETVSQEQSANLDTPSQDDVTSGEKQEDTTESETQVTEQEAFSVQKWADAFACRDGEKIVSMMTDSVKKQFAEKDLLFEESDYVAFGWSSPWPWGEKQYDIISEEQNDAVIQYYAMVSDPHVTVWTEKLHFEMVDGKMLVTAEELIFSDAISSGAEFREAYGQGIAGTVMDYQANGLGEYLNEHALESKKAADDGSENYYEKYFDPEKSLYDLLNISTEAGVTECKMTPADLDETCMHAELTFTKDQQVFEFYLYQPFGKEGVWIPTDDFLR